MKGKHSYIRIYREKEENKRKAGEAGAERLQFLVVCAVMIFWWNGFLSVFHLPLDLRVLYGGTVLSVILLGKLYHKWAAKALAAAVVLDLAAVWIAGEVLADLYRWVLENRQQLFTDRPPGNVPFGAVAVLAGIPFICLLLAVWRNGKGKTAAGILFCLPFLSAAAAGQFQDPVSAWLLIFAAALFFGSMPCGINSPGKNRCLWQYTLCSAVFCCVLILCSCQAGILLDRGREVEGSYYGKTRAWLKEGVVRELQQFLKKDTRKEEEEEPPARSEEESLSQETLPETTGGEREDFSDVSPGQRETSGDLCSLSSFSPDESVRFRLTMEEKPVSTVYIPESWGYRYRENTWEMLPRQTEAEDDRFYPEELEHVLGQVCSGFPHDSFASVSAGIETELENRAVYDINPGPTPEGKDFVTYFLLENQKGFCVHFATAATLLYRYCGYQARYVEGYAVPSSAFRQTPDGNYAADITGGMGHAWCQVYRERTLDWVDRDHTPAAATGTGEDTVHQNKPEQKKTEQSMPRPLLYTVLGLFLCVFVFFVQAFVRSAVRERRFRIKKDGEGIRHMYRALLLTAEMQGLEVADPLQEDLPGRLHRQYPELTEKEWNWIYNRVMESLFSNLPEKTGDWKTMRNLYLRFRIAAVRRMKPFCRWRFRYLICL